jgi:queuine tRNA-ribosyltransferase
MTFELERTASASRARAGRLTTRHGSIATPVFMPVGTRGTVRTQTFAQLEQLGASMLLANTYHLLLRPGAEVLETFGGLHRWSGWSGSFLTDSGGFQVFSLAGGGGTTEEGAVLRNPGDGTTHLLTPEGSIAMQRSIGSDVMMVLDQCIPSTSPLAHARAAMERTHRWAKRSLDARDQSGSSPRQALFAIVQGACVPELRRESAAALTAIDGFDGFAIGGLAVGEERAQRQDITELTAQLLPADRPRYLMGVGTPLDVIEGIHRGVDMFDCILPTAWAQHGKAFTSHGTIDLRRGVHRMAEQRLDAACDCEACTRVSRSYLHHLIKCAEPLGWQLLATHNIAFYLRLVREARAHIAADTWPAFYAERRQSLALADPDNPPGRKPKVYAGKPMTRGAFTVHVGETGIASIQHVASGEVFHSVNHPDREAEEIYVAQSEGIRRAGRGAPLVVWDIGLGAAHNAMALVRALDACPGHGEVELVSFETDLDALHLALAHGKHFSHLRHPAPNILAVRGVFERPGLRWRLVPGDFRETFAAEPAPDVIFFDPFSQKVATGPWSPSAFRALYAHLTRPTELFTFSSSTAVRAAMLGAGFFVARGVPSGPKEETTIALAHMEPEARNAYALLDREWLERRAHTIDRAIEDHAQFARVLSG